jgi:hypothetical protein
MIQISLTLSLFLSLVLAAGVTLEPHRRDLITFASDGFDPGIALLISEGDGTEKVRKRFGQPRRVDTYTEPDGREPGVIREVETWHYEGLEIVMRGDVGRPRRWVKQITLTGRQYKLKFGLNIGSTRKSFLERFGPPNPYHSKPRMFGYVPAFYGQEGSIAVGASLHLSIYFDEQDRAEKIIWAYGVL